MIGALLVTIVVEAVVATAILRRSCWIESTCIQLTTWPLAQMLLLRTGKFWPIEIGVVVVEALLWRVVLPLPLRRAALVSVAANAITIAIALQA